MVLSILVKPIALYNQALENNPINKVLERARLNVFNIN